MKFIINREEILTPLQQIVSVIEKRQTMPILSNILIVIKDESLNLTGTDLEIQIIAKLTIKSATPGAITVPARKFLDICRLLPIGAEIKFEQQNDKVKITSNKSKFSLSCLPANNYPEFLFSMSNTKKPVKMTKNEKGACFVNKMNWLT